MPTQPTTTDSAKSRFIQEIEEFDEQERPRLAARDDLDARLQEATELVEGDLNPSSPEWLDVEVLDYEVEEEVLQHDRAQVGLPPEVPLLDSLPAAPKTGNDTGVKWETEPEKPTRRKKP